MEEDIIKAYRIYNTHKEEIFPIINLARRLYSRIQMSYVRAKYNYRQADSNRWDQLFAVLAYLHPIRRANFDISVFFLKAKPNGRLLEMGCGGGAMLKLMKELGWQVEGVDFDPAAVAHARESGIQVHLGTLAEQKLPDEAFDAITASHFIEHLPDPLRELQECRRLLKPGGMLVLLTPNAESWGHGIYQTDWRGLEPPRHLHIFTPASLAGMCRRTGLNLCHCRSIMRGSGMLLASRILRRSGKANWTRSPSWGLRVWDELASLVQWAGSFVDSAAGKEILLISKK